MTISKWWEGLGSEGRSWFLISGFVALTVVGFTVGLVVASNLALVPALEPLMHVGLAMGLCGLFGGFFTTMVRLG